MSKRPYISFSEVKEKVSIPDALTALGIAERFRRKKDVLTGVCPLPNHQHGPKPNEEQFKINLRNGVWLWHCFGDCQKGGDVVEFVKEMTGFDDAHVRFWFAENFGDLLSVKKTREASKPQTPDDASDGRAKPKNAAPDKHGESPPTPAPHDDDELEPMKPLRFHLNLDPDVPYLRERGLRAETIERYGLGLCQRGILKGYIGIPVYGWPRPEGENPLAYLGRWPGDDHDETSGRPRYKWPEGFMKSHVVYGLWQALSADDIGPLIVVEGPFKVYHLVQCGFLTTVSVLGSSLSDEQADILVRVGRPIILMFDGNEAGRSGMRAAAGKLITRTFVRVARLPDQVEPDDLTTDELARYCGRCQ